MCDTVVAAKNETPFSYLAKLFDIRVSWMFNESWRGFSGLISWEASGQKKNDTNLVFWKYFKTDFLTKICSWSEISRWTSKDKPCWNQHSGLQEVARIVIFPIWGKQLEVPPKLNAWLCNSLFKLLSKNFTFKAGLIEKIKSTKVRQLNIGVELSCRKRLLLCPPFWPLSVTFAFEESQLSLGVWTLN